MRHAALLLLAAATACVPAAPRESFAIPGHESAELAQSLGGTLFLDRPVGGIVRVSLPDHDLTVVRPFGGAGSGDAIYGVSGPDRKGRLVLLQPHVASRWTMRIDTVLKVVSTNGESVLLTRPGDPLWDDTMTHPALSWSGRVAVVSKSRSDGRRYRLIEHGNVEVWDLDTGAHQEFAVDAAECPPSWFPDGRRIAFAQVTRDGKSVNYRTLILDTESGTTTPLADGGFPVVSTDGRTVTVKRGREFALLDVASGASTPIRLPGTVFDPPFAVVDSRYVLYRARPTEGVAPQNEGLFSYGRAIKLVDVQTGRFATVFADISNLTDVTGVYAFKP
ncbi:MAG TPA: hypothetical protein VF980_20365 [Thermoanaerobaculia bacterium]